MSTHIKSIKQDLRTLHLHNEPSNLENHGVVLAKLKSFVRAIPEESDSDDEPIKSGKMPFAANVHTAARNNYFNNKINPPN